LISQTKLPPDIKVIKYNEVYYRVNAERGIRESLREWMSWRPPDYKHMPRYKAKIWDGFVSLYSFKQSLFPIGQRDRLIEFARLGKFSIELPAADHMPIDRRDILAYVDGLGIHLPGDADVRHYQYEAIYQMLRNKRRAISLPTSSGKSAVMYAVANYMEITKRQTLIIVPTINLVNQMAGDFYDYGYDRELHKIFFGNPKEHMSNIVVSTWQSLQSFIPTERREKKTGKWIINKGNPEFFRQVDCVMVDEVHIGSKESSAITDMLKLMSNASFRYGLTGTFPEDELTRQNIIGFIGPEFTGTTMKEMMDEGHVVPLEIDAYEFEYRNTIVAYRRKLVKNYRQEYKFLREELPPYRFPKIYQVLSNYVTQDTNTLVLFSGNKHGKNLHEYLNMKFPDRNVLFVCGKIDQEVRQKIIDLMKKTTNNILVASYETFSTGINIPNLHHVMFATPSKSSIRVVQSIGRGIRLYDNKDRAILIDIWDNLGITSFGTRHFEDRLAIYNKQGFKYSFKGTI